MAYQLRSLNEPRALHRRKRQLEHWWVRVFSDPISLHIENRLTGQSTMFSSGGYQYGYAPGNKRVWKAVCCDSSNNPIEEITFWSVTGQKLATYQLVSTPVQMVPTTIPPVLSANQTGTNYYF